MENNNPTRIDRIIDYFFISKNLLELYIPEIQII